MKAIRVHKLGGPEVLQFEEIAEPQPGPGQVAVKVEAIGVNFIDTYLRSGQYKMALPGTLGREAAGTVIALGEGVANLRVGERVAGADVPAAYAEVVVAPADRLVPLPPGLDVRHAAAVMLQGMTAHYLAVSTYPLREGETCLVHAAAGGVGLSLCQIARMRGARVIATVSSEEKAARATEAGANDVIRYDQVDFAAALKKLTEGRGVDVVYDSVGRDTFDRSLLSLRRRGMLVLYGQSSGAVPPLDPQRLAMAGSAFLTRATLADYIATREDLLGRAADLFEWIASGKLSVRIGLELPLADAAEAHRRLEGRLTTGKVLLIP